MIDFPTYVLFMIIGGTVGAFFGWLVMRKLWSGNPIDKDTLGTILAAILAIFGASR